MKTVKTAALLLALLPQVGTASSGGAVLPNENWGFQGIFGKFDQGALKRGAQVVVQVCLGCHGVKYIKFDQLRKIGLNENEVIQLAEFVGKSKNDSMKSSMDPESAKESFGVVPPDLSLITKARKGYENYTFGLLTGYVTEQEKALVDKALADNNLSDTEIKELAATLQLDASHPDKMREVLTRIQNGDNFNKYFPGHFFAMPMPLASGAVEYVDGTENSQKQLARDAVTFLAWAAEPTMEERKSAGINVMLYLVVFTAMLYAVKRRVWAKVHH
ncbi:MAG: hypothetical protein HQM02_06850 [Magnetococcales bacterium]|nr:hypothetical protein [Magnetococcales bacterium]